MMRLVFCGTPTFAVPTLKALRAAGHAIELVLCQPDRPSGRGLSLAVPPVKQAALDAGLEVLQPEKIRTNAWGSFTVLAVLLLLAAMVALVAFIVLHSRFMALGGIKNYAAPV